MKLNYKNSLILAIGILSIIVLLKCDIRIPCFFHTITGLFCPGCGGTRAMEAIFNLKIYQALRYNALIILLLPFAIPYIIYRFILNGKKRIPDMIWIFLLIITIIFGIIRNISYFHFLSPIDIL